MGRKTLQRINTNHNKNLAIFTKYLLFEAWLWKVYSNATTKGKMACKHLFLIQLVPIYTCIPIFKQESYFQGALKLALKAKLNSRAKKEKERKKKSDFSMHSSEFLSHCLIKILATICL